MSQALIENKSNRKLPFNFKQEDKYLFEHELVKTYYDPFFKVIHNCYASHYLLIIKKYKIIFDDKYNRPDVLIKSLILRLRIMNSIIFKKKKTPINKSILAVDNWSKGYFHWLMDVLPKLISLPEQYRSYTLLLPKEYKEIAFITESLRLLNFNEVYYFEKHEAIKAKELVIPGIMSTTGNYNDSVMNLLREQVLGAFKNSAMRSYRLFILRKKSITRQIVNELEIVELVKEYGFDVIDFEELTWKEQVQMMSSCSILIGLHGAGLANMLFMHKGTIVIELRRRDDFHNNCYFSLASALQLNYLYQLCEVNNENIVTQENDFFVNKVLLEENIKTALKIEYV